MLTEDAADPRVAELCARRFPFVRVLMNAPKLGQMASIDRIYGEIATPFVLHLEDDWRFDAAPDLAAAIALLKAAADVSAVCLRAFAEVKPRFREKADIVEAAGARFAVMRADADETWFGYTFNPSIVRRSFWEAQGGFARFGGEVA